MFFFMFREKECRGGADLPATQLVSQLSLGRPKQSADAGPVFREPRFPVLDGRE